ncbi:MAG: DnaJ domain-containing protein [Myxococcales bacterium]|nr:DnaJ domain-containing protein [Myxococcales bacterium]
MGGEGKDLYAVLGVTRDVDDAALRVAYRKLARTYHPDVNPGDKGAEERFKEVSSAYEVLSDANKRKSYDEFGDESLRGGFDAEQARAYSQWKGRRERSGSPFEREYVDLEDLFGGGFSGQAYSGRGFGGGAAPSLRGQDIYAIAELDLSQVVNGAEVSLTTPGASKPTRVRIPAGAETGDTIRLRGKGGPGMGKGGAGDLVIETRVREHPSVHRRGLDLTLRVPVTLGEAYNGATLEVPTFAGVVKLKVPPRTQNGAKLRLRGKGISRKDKQGDFFVELELRLPEKDSEELAEILRTSDELYLQPPRKELRL